MKLSEFDYHLPKDRIAQYPVAERDSSGLMIIHRKHGKIEHRIFRDIVEYLYPGDVLILNDTKVIPARIFGRSPSGRKVEVMLLKELCPNKWEAIARGQRCGQVVFEDGISGHVSRKNGTATITFADETIIPIDIDTEKYEDSQGILPRQSGKSESTRTEMPDLFSDHTKKMFKKFGVMPLPPYIKRHADELDIVRYQTVYAEKEGAVAAPTAGLHFTEELIRKIRDKGVEVKKLTHHVGYGTFKPISCTEIENHHMDDEDYYIPADTAEAVNLAKAEGRRVIAVGTTVARALEAAACEINGRLEIENMGNKRKIEAGQGKASIFIYPGYKFMVIDALITNFHLPKSTPMMLASAFAGLDTLKEAYTEAKRLGYRFFSYGDAMLIT